jgi:hypothetical protein
MKKLLILATLLTALMPFASQAGVLAFDPTTGALDVQPGATTGFGYSITSSGYYILVTSDPACTITSGTGLATATCLINTYFQNVWDPQGGLVVGPNPTAPSVSSLTQPFDATAATGAVELLIDSSAPSGSHILGTVSFSYDVYSGDPNDFNNFDPFTQTIATGQLESDTFDVTVVPEPASLWIAAPMALALMAFRRRRR